jgi:anti-anti-sigma regulatory factor
VDIRQERLEQAGMAGDVVVWIEGKATIHGAAELKAALVEAFDSARKVVLDTSGVTEIDAAFLQLLCAARKSAIAANKVFQLGGCCPEALAKGFVDAGFPLPSVVAGEYAATQSGHGGDDR